MKAKNKTMRILVTGASGFVGGALARRLASAGHEVTALVRRTSNRKELEKIPGLQFAFGDLVTGEGLAEAVTGKDVIHHVAGVTKARTAEEYNRGNAEGTRRVCQAIVASGAKSRLVLCSSLAAAGPARVGSPRREDQKPAPVSVYGRSKLGAEMAARQFADRIATTIVRPPMVFGPGDTVNLPAILPMARLGIYLKAGLVGPKHFSWIHVEDLCDALHAASLRGQTLDANDPAAGVYHVADPRAYSWQEICLTLNRTLGRKRAVIVPVPQALGYAVGYASELVGRVTNNVPIMSVDKAREMQSEAWTCAVERAERDLGFKVAYPLERGLQHTLEWMRREGLA